MSRYVILSFAFMGIAFFELSGGADFQPGSHTTAEALGIAPRNVDQTQQVAELAPRADTTGTSLPGIVPASLPAVAGRAQPEAVISPASLETPKVAKGIAATTPVRNACDRNSGTDR